MPDYEIRLLKADRSTDMVIEVVHVADGAAIAAARKLAEARPFEVWRGLKRIHARPDRPLPHPDEMPPEAAGWDRLLL